MRALTLILLIACCIIAFLGGYDYASRQAQRTCCSSASTTMRQELTANGTMHVVSLPMWD